jgi:xanthine dehydrogenase accessory factor
MSLVLLRGGGDLATGVALRLHRAGIRVAIAELERPLVVRRTVAFAEAVYAGVVDVEGVVARRVQKVIVAPAVAAEGEIPVLVDPMLASLPALAPAALVDARMLKRDVDTTMDVAPLVIGLGPGFEAGANCHAVVETMRGHSLGRVIWQGGAQPDTGVPGTIASQNLDRVLRAPANGTVEPHFKIGDRVKRGDRIATVSGEPVVAAFHGVLRGLVHPSLEVKQGTKIGDVDPRNDPSYIHRVSDKSLAIGGGVLEALLARPQIRSRLWE